jgi:predicted enzyme related to lactoylglutathione lyase
MMNVRSAWVTLAAMDFERSLQFYRALLDQDPTSQIPNVYAEFQLAGLRLGIYRPRANELSSPANQIEESSSFPTLSLCLEVENLERAIAHLSHLNCLLGAVITAAHGQEIYAYDPDGNRLILFQPSA